MTNDYAVLFDIDGTLTDTNYLHTLAWQRAFTALSHDIPAVRIHRRIGMGAPQLINDLLGDDAESQEEALKDAWRKAFDPLKGEIRALPEAGELLRAVAARGTAVVLASSSEEQDLPALLRAIDADDAISAVTSSGDVDQAKPSPEVFQAALRKSGLLSERAIVVGDTVWDIKAARRAGLDCVCLLTGGIGPGELRDAGAVAVYQSPADLLIHLDESPLRPFLR